MMKTRTGTITNKANNAGVSNSRLLTMPQSAVLSDKQCFFEAGHIQTGKQSDSFCLQCQHVWAKA
eukprot:4977505-Amphidinium_carterae.1